jgi:hypothetical protein
MARIQITDLCPSDFDWSVDSESFLDELNESDLSTINGGSLFRVVIGVTLWALSQV